MRALIITDVQNDFMPGGALGVAYGDEIIPIINRLIPQFECVVATQDWHPPDHVSFAPTHRRKVGEVIQSSGIEQILWPIHCVQNTRGADFVKALHRDRIEAVFHKGVDPKVDSYSTFFDNARHRSTGLSDYLKKKKISDLYFVGLATDYCILYSVLDALELGFQATAIRDACRAINLHPNDEEKALKKMTQKGARILRSSDLQS